MSAYLQHEKWILAAGKRKSRTALTIVHGGRLDNRGSSAWEVKVARDRYRFRQMRHPANQRSFTQHFCVCAGREHARNSPNTEAFCLDHCAVNDAEDENFTQQCEKHIAEESTPFEAQAEQRNEFGSAISSVSFVQSRWDASSASDEFQQRQSNFRDMQRTIAEVGGGIPEEGIDDELTNRLLVRVLNCLAAHILQIMTTDHTSVHRPSTLHIRVVCTLRIDGALL
eukprot:SAG31_NODE_1845_length_7104_cov_2.447680_5_plen_226_part_00